MKSWIKKQKAQVLLGLTFDGKRVDAVVVRRSNDSAEPGPAIAFELTNDLLSGEVAVLAAELRRQLDAAGVKERRCVVGLPLDWALTLTMPMPDLPEEDLLDLWQLEAERGFPYAPEALMIAQTRFVFPNAGAGAMQVAVPLDRIQRVEEILKGAKLIPVSFTLAFPVMVEAAAGSSGPAVTIEVDAGSLAVAIGGTGGIAALRSLAGIFETGGPELYVRADQVARELRVTVGQLAPEIRESLKQLRIVGPGSVADRLSTDLQARAASLGLMVERVTTVSGATLGLEVPAGRTLTGALAISVRHLAGRPNSMEFLPPRMTPWQSFTSRYSSKRLAYVGMAAAVVAFGTLVAFGVQQVQIESNESEWRGMSNRVAQVQDAQQQIRRYRPWFDESYRTLAILKKLTEAYPEDGSVTAKRIELRDAGMVVCSGTARDYPSLSKTLDHLRSASQVADVQVENLQGKSPLLFTFNFHWDSQGRQP